MSDAFVALFLAAGVSGVAYSQLGKRVGYGNQKSVLSIIVIAFVIVFIVALTLLKYVLHIH